MTRRYQQYFAWSAIWLLTWLSSANAFFVMSCGALSMERADPVVSPGQSPSSHVHLIGGSLAFTVDETTNSARTGKCTTCPIKQDLSNYWAPMLYFHHKEKGFIASKTANFVVYYKYEAGQGFEPFPNNFRMVSGSPGKRNATDDTPEGWSISWKCVGGDTTTDHSGIPSEKCPNGLRAQVSFPSCGNGDTDSDDHTSHVKFPESLVPGTSTRQGDYPGNYSCPDGFKHKYPRIFLEVYFSNTDYDWSDAANPDQPMVLAMGDPTGYGMHADFLTGWDSDVLQDALDNCDGTGADGNDADGRPEYCTKNGQQVFKNLDLNSDGQLAASTCAKPDPNKGLTITEDVGDNDYIDKLLGCNAVTETTVE